MTNEEKLDLILDEIKNLKSEVKYLKSEVQDLKRQQMKNTAELKAMDDIIFDEVERVHEIMLRRTDELKQKIG